MSFYSDMQQTANSMLSEFGQSVTITRKTSGAYDPAFGSVTITTTTQTGTGAIFDYGDRDINGTLVLQGDKKLLLSQIGIDDIEVNDTVTLGSNTYTVTNVKTLDPAGTNVMFVCNVRGVQ